MCSGDGGGVSSWLSSLQKLWLWYSPAAEEPLRTRARAATQRQGDYWEQALEHRLISSSSAASARLCRHST
jgi:hypothetical protein